MQKYDVDLIILKSKTVFGTESEMFVGKKMKTGCTEVHLCKKHDF